MLWYNYSSNAGIVVGHYLVTWRWTWTWTWTESTKTWRYLTGTTPTPRRQHCCNWYPLPWSVGTSRVHPGTRRRTEMVTNKPERFLEPVSRGAGGVERAWLGWPDTTVHNRLSLAMQSCNIIHFSETMHTFRNLVQCTSVKNECSKRGNPPYFNTVWAPRASK